MIQKNENGEILYTYLDEHFEPRENLSPYALMDKWRVVPVGTAEYSSNMLACNGGCPEDITLSPALTGWYKIYLHAPGQSVLHLKLTSDPAFWVASVNTRNFYTMEEFLWRCADMTGESLTLTRKLDAANYHSLLAAIRFVPMTVDELADYQRQGLKMSISLRMGAWGLTYPLTNTILTAILCRSTRSGAPMTATETKSRQCLTPTLRCGNL